MTQSGKVCTLANVHGSFCKTCSQKGLSLTSSSMTSSLASRAQSKGLLTQVW